MKDPEARPIPGFDYREKLGDPGAPPFTRGIYPGMYADRPWTIRQYAGFGDAKATNERFRTLLERGQTGLSIAFDLPTQMGFDPDHPRAKGEVGRAGVSIASLADMQEVLAGIPLDRVSVSMTINATAHILLALQVAAAESQGIPKERLAGTVQNDILKEFIARGCYIYPPGPSMKLAADVIEYSVRELPRWNFISVSGYHMREAGCTASQEIGFTISNAVAYLQAGIERGLDAAGIARRMSFFFAAHNDLFEEIAKFRAARRLWANLLAERFGIRDEAARRLRFHVQTAGSTLTSREPENNIVRVTLQAMAAILGGAQSIHTNSFDEALGLPSETAATLALRTQQVLQLEMGLCDVADPFGGSWHLERETDRLEEEARGWIARVDEHGGAVRAAAEGYQKREIEKSALQYQREIEEGTRRIVGVNAYVCDAPARVDVFRIDESLERARIEAVRTLRRSRDARAAARALDRLRRNRGNVMPPTLDCVRSNVTLGEISAALAEVWGRYEPSGGRV